MISLSDFSAVIFDLDGLVLDTERTYRIAWRKAGSDLGYEFPEPFLSAMTGLPDKEILARIKSRCGAEFNVDEFKRLSSEHWHQHVGRFGIDVKIGVTELLTFLGDRQIPYALATNSHSSNAVENLRLAGLDGVFALQSTRENVLHGKPAPDLLLYAAQQLNTPIQDCLVLEDSLVGVTAAIRACATPVLITSEAPTPPVPDSFDCCRYNDLLEFLADLVHSIA